MVSLIDVPAVYPDDEASIEGSNDEGIMLILV
jgi:hypothetical protein